jgi:signal transduction histidine kinase
VVAWRWRAIRRYQDAVREISRAIDRMADGDLDAPLDLEPGGPLGDVAFQLERMRQSQLGRVQRIVLDAEETNHTKNLAVLGAATSQVNHEIGNFLNNLILTLSILKKDALSETSLASLRIIEDNAHQIKRFVIRLLSMVRKTDLRLKPWDPAQEIGDLCRYLERWAGECGVSLETRADHPPMVLVDPDLIKPALVNIVQNAVEASPSGSAVEIFAEGDEDGLEIKVRDRGRGVAAADLDNVFTPFFTSKKQRGTGLGLSLAHTFIQAHGGEIAFRSRLGNGTTVTVWLPPAPPCLQPPDPPPSAGADPLGVDPAEPATAMATSDEEPPTTEPDAGN